MASQGRCINGTLDDTNYSSSVPVTGLFIAAATLVCMLLMIYDTIVGFYRRKRWLPCKMFKLNSITLALLSVGVKLTMDLKSPMPSVWDQLSKLCGTTLLCAYMGYIMPSVGVMNDSTNMYSLSILVITVIVNMCIQISTGVIVLFIPQHIIILCFMLAFLLLLWFCVWNLKNVRRHTSETSKNLFRSCKETVLEKLKICYLYGYVSDSQFIACEAYATFVIGGFNLFCLVILIQAAYRSVIMKSEMWCIGNSDYDWSMPIIVVTQILTVIVGSSVSIFRWLVMIDHGNNSFDIGEGEPYARNPIFVDRQFPQSRYFLKVLLAIFFFISLITFPLSFIAACFERAMVKSKSGNNAFIRKFKNLTQDRVGFNKWTLHKGLTEMEKEIKCSESEPNEFIELLSKITPSQQSQVEHISDRVGSDGGSIPVSILSVVLLVRIAQVSLPKDLNSSLVKTFQEVYKFLCFIEENLYLTSPEVAKNLEVAKAVWLANDFSRLAVQNFDERKNGRSQSDINCALTIIADVKSKLPEDMIYSELSIIENFIKHREYSSIKELYDVIEQLYVDMLHVILVQFPTATFNALSIGSAGDDYLKRAKLALKFVSKIERLEAQIQWKFPQGSNLLGLITAPVLVTEEESNVAVNNHDVFHATEDTTVTVTAMMMHDAIIEVGDGIVETVY